MAEPIKYESTLPQLIQSLLGSRTATQTGANVDPLMKVFEAAMTAQGAGVPEMQQLITSIFQEGAKQVPGIVQAYGNATGTRAGNNGTIALALNDLNKQMSTAAATAILDNQNKNRQIAGQAGEGVAQATRNSTATTKPAVNPLLPIVAGWGLNAFGKSKKGQGFLDSIFGDTTSPSAVNLGTVTGPDASLASDFGPASNTGAVDLGTITGGAADLGSDFGTTGVDTSNAVTALDTGSGAVDLGTASSDALDAASDFGAASDVGDLSDFFGWKNGGAIRVPPVKKMANGGGVMPGVADDVGGTVTGTPDARRRKGAGIGTDNPGFSDDGSGLGLNIGSSVAGPSGGGGTVAIDTPDFTGGGVGSGTGDGSTPGDGGLPTGVTPSATPAAVGGFIGGLVSVATGLPIGPIVSHVIQALSTPSVPISMTVTPGPLSVGTTGGTSSGTGTAATGNTGPSASIGIGDTDDGPEGTAQGETLGVAPENAEGVDSDAAAASAATAEGTAGDSAAGTAGIGSAASDAAAASADSGATGGESGGSDSADSGSGSGDGGDGGYADGGVLSAAINQQMMKGKKMKPAAYKDGGMVTGPGTGTSDSIPIAGSAGEYMMPEDVVRFWGTRTLDAMKNAIHTPVA